MVARCRFVRPYFYKDPEMDWMVNGYFCKTLKCFCSLAWILFILFKRTYVSAYAQPNLHACPTHYIVKILHFPTVSPVVVNLLSDPYNLKQPKYI